MPTTRPAAALLLLLAAAAAAACAGAAPMPPGHAGTQAAAPAYVVDLDAPAAERWTHVVTPYRAVYQNDVRAWIDSMAPAWLIKLGDALFAAVDGGMGEFGQEVAGVAAATGLPVGTITMLNLIYDLSGCTSIVSQAPDGAVLHARNLDYPIDWLHNITVQVEFQRGGERAYRCTTFAGYVGCLTGLRDDGWSVTVDERDTGASLLDDVLSGLGGGRSLGWFVRQTLDKEATYAGALGALQTTPLMAPVYIIVAGLARNEGAVVTRNRTHAVDTWHLGDGGVGGDGAPWYVLETNYDHWMPNPARDPRREVANAGMARIGGAANVTLDALYDVISTPPVFNDGTKYSVLMQPSTSHYEAYVRSNPPAGAAYPRKAGFERLFASVPPPFLR